jgi:Haemolymph juvenile hormone binding protein (JHBP)
VKSLAPSFKLCPRASPNLAQCVKESIEILRPRLKDGDFGGGFVISPLEPLSIDDINIRRGDGFYVNLSNLRAVGAMNFKIEKLRINIDNFKVDAIVTVPRIEAYGQYKLNMLLGVLNLNGQGSMQSVLGNG